MMHGQSAGLSATAVRAVTSSTRAVQAVTPRAGLQRALRAHNIWFDERATTISARSRSSGNPGHSRNSPGGYRKIL